LTQEGTFVEFETFTDCVSFINNKSINTLLDRLLIMDQIQPIDLGYPSYEDIENLNFTDFYKLYSVKYYENGDVEEINSKITGKMLFSALLPENFNYFHGNVKIINGILLSGTLTSEHVSNSSKSIIIAIRKQFDNNAAADFIDNAHVLLNRWFDNVGFSIGLKDCFPDIVNEGESIDDAFKRHKTKVDKIVKDTRDKIIRKSYDIGRTTISLPDDPVTSELYKRQVISDSNITGMLGIIVKENFSDENNFMQMIRSGAKGNITNLIKISGSISQQYIGGSIPFPSKQQRCLSHIHPENIDPVSTGFCTGNFLEGIGQVDYYYQIRASRTSLMNTFLKTSDTGDWRRKAKSGTKYIRSYYGPVRNIENKMIQHLFGGDGFDPENLEKTVVEGKHFIFTTDLSRLTATINEKYKAKLKVAQKLKGRLHSDTN
jgi:DNA-directed RNA polymerase beta' subunit